MGEQAILDLFQNMCRVCMNTKSDLLISLSDEQAKMFVACTDLDITTDDRLPKRICSICCRVLSDTIAFKHQCISSNALLKRLLQEDILKTEDIKQEIKDEISDNDSAVCNDMNDRIDEDDIPLKDIFQSAFKKHRKHKSKHKKHKLKPDNTGEVAYDCGLCKSEFSTCDSLATHLETHSGETVCKMCHETCRDWPHLLTHSQEHVKNWMPFCYICKLRISSLEAMEFHIRVKHLGEKGIKCKLCDKFFMTLRYLKKHMAVHSIIKRFECSKCPKKFKTMQLLKNHLKMHANEKKYVCDECGFSCNFSTGLRCHLQRKHSTGVYKCASCPKEFTNKETLADHRRTHETQCVCAECGKAFGRSGLARHARTHSRARPHACDLCPAAFAAASTLRNHRRRHTGERPYRCRLCAAAFHTQNVLVKHVRTHTGERPYVCRLCGRAFTGGHNLKVHMKIHGQNLISKKKQPNSDEDAKSQ